MTGDILANLTYLHYGYLDWISKQAVPWTATDEYLEGWAALRGVTRKPATTARGAVRFHGTPGKTISAGSAIVRGDGVVYTTDDAAQVGADNTVTVQATALADAAGLTGAIGNTAVGVAMTLAHATDGVQSNGVVVVPFTGGADLENNDALRARMLAAYSQDGTGATASNYAVWALEVPGCTRAWVVPHGYGAGSVVVYVMYDEANAATGGFPVGTDGVSRFEAGPGGLPRAPVATGDQGTVADYLYPRESPTALVFVVSPLAQPIAFTLAGVPLALQDAVSAAIAATLRSEGSPISSVVALSDIWRAIARVPGVRDFLILSPSADIPVSAGHLPVLGVVTWA
nr:baseplate J/gp47 family protein [Paraburkholderia sp. BL8N3]